MSSANDPTMQLQKWLADAAACGAIEEPTAMTLATVDEHGLPDARIVLLKGVSEAGLTFYTNLGSAKAAQLRANPHAALCFHWAPLERQVRVRGAVSRVSDAEADAYFATRPRQSQIGAWASKQSQPLEERLELERRIARFAAKYALGAVPRPEFWSGFRVAPVSVEFWQKRAFRLHERQVFVRENTTSPWQSHWAYP
jgi:pyridoxamine 5'-phosphate oxidase